MILTVGVTGGTGFIGKKIVDSLVKEGVNVVSLQRTARHTTSIQTRRFDLSKSQTFNKGLVDGIDVIIHTAALVHDTSATGSEHDSLNKEATSKLFKLSLEGNVKKFIFISTVGVYGVSSCRSPINLQTSINPSTAYAKSKRASEIELLESSRSDMKVSVLRLPLVTGTDAPGTYGLLEMISQTKFPLPFGLCDNKRSIVTVETVAQVVTHAALNISAFEGLQLVAESPPVSTKELIVKLRKARGMSSNLFPVPKVIMRLMLSAVGRKRIYEQLYEDLVFESSIEVKKYINAS